MNDLNRSALTPEQAHMAHQFLFHYAQSHVWRAEADSARDRGDAEGSAHAEQHALGHALHVAHIRHQLPSRVSNAIQARANEYGKRASGAIGRDPLPGGDLSWVPASMRTPQLADEVPINGGGLNGDAKWQPPEAR